MRATFFGAVALASAFSSLASPSAGELGAGVMASLVAAGCARSPMDSEQTLRLYKYQANAISAIRIRITISWSLLLRTASGDGGCGTPGRELIVSDLRGHKCSTGTHNLPY